MHIGENQTSGGSKPAKDSRNGASISIKLEEGWERIIILLSTMYPIVQPEDSIPTALLPTAVKDSWALRLKDGLCIIHDELAGSGEALHRLQRFVDDHWAMVGDGGRWWMMLATCSLPGVPGFQDLCFIVSPFHFPLLSLAKMIEPPAIGLSLRLASGIARN